MEILPSFASLRILGRFQMCSSLLTTPETKAWTLLGSPVLVTWAHISSRTPGQIRILTFEQPHIILYI